MKIHAQSETKFSGQGESELVCVLHAYELVSCPSSMWLKLKACTFI